MNVYQLAAASPPMAVQFATRNMGPTLQRAACLLLLDHRQLLHRKAAGFGDRVNAHTTGWLLDGRFLAEMASIFKRAHVSDNANDFDWKASVTWQVIRKMTDIFLATEMADGRKAFDEMASFCLRVHELDPKWEDVDPNTAEAIVGDWLHPYEDQWHASLKRALVRHAEQLNPGRGGAVATMMLLEAPDGGTLVKAIREFEDADMKGQPTQALGWAR